MNNLQNHNIDPRRPVRRRNGFTLIEVMISVALVLLLMYGVSQVFKLTGDAVGANQAVSKIIRDHRAAAATLADDFRNCAQDSPLFLISNRIGYTGPTPANNPTWVTGFRNAEEQRNNRNDDPTFLDGATTATPFLKLGASDRVPRLDRLGFFARSLYRRQSTPDVQPPPGLVPVPGLESKSSGEAYIWVGHVVVQPPGGGLPQVPEKQFGADRILGRMAILLKNVPNSNALEVKYGVPFVGEKPGALAPFGYDAQDFTKYSDVARTSIDQFRQDADSYYQAQGPNNWFRPMEDNGSNFMRYRCNPTVSRPMKPQALSQSVPYFVGNCTQFIVEYAGDYLNQDAATGDLVSGPQNLTPGTSYDPTKNDVSELVNPADGSIISGRTDGQIDFIVDKTVNATDPTKWFHRVRWYGLPRDVTGDGAINTDDVIPLADVLEWQGIKVNNSPALAPWEKALPNPSLKGSGNNYANFANSSANNFAYTCAWHNDAPPMVRILIKIDDPTGKLQDGQWYEYIFTR